MIALTRQGHAVVCRLFAAWNAAVVLFGPRSERLVRGEIV
jgi:hypothetical protein